MMELDLNKLMETAFWMIIIIGGASAIFALLGGLSELLENWYDDTPR
jgi:hypothetical protein